MGDFTEQVLFGTLSRSPACVGNDGRNVRKMVPNMFEIFVNIKSHLSLNLNGQH